MVAFEILIHAGFLASSRVMMFFMRVDCAYNIVHMLVWCWLCGTSQFT